MFIGIGLPIVNPSSRQLPALDLPFADSGVLDSRVTFTGGANRTYFNSAGVLTAGTVNVPRFDHDATTLAPLGMAVFEARTNVFWNSLAPVTQTRTIVDATEYTISLVGTGSLALSGGLAGTVTDGSPVTVTSTTTSGTFTLTGSADGVNCEAGACATPIIVTAGASATATADVATMTGTNFSDWFNQSEGTLLIEAVMPSAEQGEFRFFGKLSDGGNNNRIDIPLDTAERVDVAISDGGVLQASLRSLEALAVSSDVSIAIAYKANDFGLSVNGAAVVTDTSGSVPTGMDQFDIGMRHSDDRQINGHISRIMYWDTRLSDSRLVSEST